MTGEDRSRGCLGFLLKMTGTTAQTLFYSHRLLSIFTLFSSSVFINLCRLMNL
ncbi:hypothetical protein HanRHA438_Chr03g0127531 [Helianthus annuus]|nr:hypothetical protein HanRHA438_Chr03g0127531 [Helianthus annuus]